MNELSLFSGAGGGLLGTKLLGFNHIGYVEYNEYCQKVLAQRIKDGYLDNAPIYGDIRTFIDSGRCELYRGVTDIITAGFPCQPFSVAGKREASNDERNMWPATMDVIKRVNPPFCLLENVPGLLSATVDNESDGPVYYFGEILRDLAEGGYDAKWCVLGADDVGAPHRRKRLWLLATNTNYSRRSDGCNNRQERQVCETKKRKTSKGKSERNGRKLRSSKDNDSINAEGQSIDVSRLEFTKHQEQSKSQLGNSGEQVNVADLRSKRGEGVEQKAIQRFSGLPWGENLRSIEDIQRRPDIPEPIIRRMDDGMACVLDFPNRAYRLQAVGNGQCPQTVAAAYKILSGQ